MPHREPGSARRRPDCSVDEVGDTDRQPHAAERPGEGDLVTLLDAERREGRLVDQDDRPARGRTVVVVAVLEAMPGVGKVRAQRIMERLEISPSRRVRGLGAKQREALVQEFSSS